MSESVKRRYSSPLRARQAEQTRRVIVAAAARLFVEVGYGRTSVDAVAEAAGVSRKTVFSAVGGKVELLKLAIDWAVVGDDAPTPLLERDEAIRLAHAPDPVLMLQGWAQLTAAIDRRLAGLSSALLVAAAVDDQAAELLAAGQQQRLKGSRAFVEELTRQAILAPDLSRDDAADLVWLYSDPSLYARLVHERGWTHDKFEQWLTKITQQLLG